MVGQASGRVGGAVFTRGSSGAVVRNGVIPTNKQTILQHHNRATLAQLARHWQRLTAAQRRAWVSWAKQNPTKNRLGRKIQITGAQAFTSTAFLLTLGGGAIIETPPTAPAPPALESLSLSADIGAGNVEITFGPSPLPFPLMLVVRADPGTSPARQPKQSQMTITSLSPVMHASPFEFQTDVEDHFGTIQIGQRLAVQVSQFNLLRGLESLAIHDNSIVVST